MLGVLLAAIYLWIIKWKQVNLKWYKRVAHAEKNATIALVETSIPNGHVTSLMNMLMLNIVLNRKPEGKRLIERRAGAWMKWGIT